MLQTRAIVKALGALFLAGCGSWAGARADRVDPGGEAAAANLSAAWLLKPAGAHAGTVTALAARHGFARADRPDGRLHEIGWFRLVATRRANPRSLRADPNVETIEPDPIRRMLPTEVLESQGVSLSLSVPYDDPFVQRQYAVPLIGLAAAHKVGRGSPGTVLAVLDAGVDGAHPDFRDGTGKSRVVPGFDAFAPAPGEAGKDRNGHGTHVAGIAAASANNGLGVVGVAPGVTILAEKVLSDQGSGTWSGVAEGILDAVARRARVLNLSLGDPQSAKVLEDALAHAARHDVLVVAASGNDGQNRRQYPAAHPGVLAVGATTKADVLAGFSNHGDWLSVA
ncbi:MAG: S8 family serine peptidase, partial [Candidatus Sericytochromatia bacterium]|nr:S8 family serine peptidase [Candidatus Tanganyikabacteria bacterium]